VKKKVYPERNSGKRKTRTFTPEHQEMDPLYLLPADPRDDLLCLTRYYHDGSKKRDRDRKHDPLHSALYHLFVRSTPMVRRFCPKGAWQETCSPVMKQTVKDGWPDDRGPEDQELRRLAGASTFCRCFGVCQLQGMFKGMPNGP
jgi:hypothetical protein